MKNLSFKLLVSLTLFSIIIISVMSFTTRQLLLYDINSQQQILRDDIENNILTDLDTMNKAHSIFQEIESNEMRKGLYELRDYYEENPDIYSWDLNAIKQSIGNMEFYILDKDNKTAITTHEPSKNMDFNECCQKFVSLIQERLQTDQFYFDGLENSVATRDQWMYSYLPTKDHQYLLEFGIRFSDTNVAKEFNYEETVSQLIDNHKDLIDLRIMTMEGFVLNIDGELLTHADMENKIREAFLQTASTSQKTEIIETFDDGYKETHRFIPYKADEIRGNSSQRIIYAKYGNESEQALLQKNSTQFLVMLTIGIMTSVLLLMVILKLLNNTIRLATYDTLTGAYNRASYLQHMDQLIHARSHFPVGLMLIDLDNFKKVNDLYGHAEGDNVLRDAVTLLKEVVGKDGYVVRFGGDEFAIVYEKATKEFLELSAHAILQEMRNRRHIALSPSWEILSMSIGATIQQEPLEEENSLFERADKALYTTKNKGKDNYTFFPPSSITDQVNLVKYNEFSV